MPIDDELLVAYADGELDAEQSARVERAVNEDPVLQARLVALTRAADLTRELFEAKSRDPVPPELIERILAGVDAPARQLEEPRRSLGERLADWWQIPLPAAAFGALTLLAVGGLLGYLLPADPVDGPAGGAITTAGVVPPDSALHLLLQEYSSGATLADGTLNLEAVATFVDGDRICREYRAIRDTGPHEYHAGIACRGDGNDWRVAFAVDEYLAEEPVGGFYETASNKLHEAVDGFIEEYLDVDPLDDAAERTWIARGWRSEE
jgi:hypothetical protein